MKGRAAACGAAIAILCFSTPGLAHEERALHALTVLDAVEPDVPGLEVRVVHLGGPALAVRNTTHRVLTVLSSAGEAFLRIGDSGVQMNVESRAAYRSVNPDNDFIPPGIDGTKNPRWVEVSQRPSWTWFDPRLVFSQTNPEWAIPLRLDGNRLTVSGSYESLHGHGHFRSAIAAPAIDGLEMRLAEGPVPALFVRNESGRVLLVKGRAGEPMLRIGPGGVNANLRSPSYYTSAAQTIARVPRSADAGASPKWKRVSTEPVWAWLEYRAAVAPEMQRRDSLGSEPATVLEWESPMLLGGRPLEVAGRVEWLPPSVSPTGRGTDLSLTPWWIATALIVGCGLVFSSLRRNAAVT